MWHIGCYPENLEYTNPKHFDQHLDLNFYAAVCVWNGYW